MCVPKRIKVCACRTINIFSEMFDGFSLSWPFDDLIHETMSGEALAQVTKRICRCPIPGSF